VKRWHYIILAIFSYVFFVAANTPAATVLGWIKKSTPLPVQIYGVEGSIWNGHADTVILKNQTRVTQLDWSINPFALFIAQLSAGLDGQIAQQGFSADIKLQRDGAMRIEDLQTRLPAKDVQQLLDIPLGEFGGQFEIDMSEIDWQATGLQSATGIIHWNSASVSLGDTMELGNITLDVVTDDNKQINASIKNSGGMLAMDGKISFDPAQNYNADIVFKIKPETPVPVVQSLSMFAPRQADGGYRFKQSGNMHQLGF
jgi:hypothetical protein